MFRLVSVIAAAFFLSACATDRTFGVAPSVEVSDLTSLPEPTGQISYVVGPREKLEIQVVGAEELSGVFLTDDAGNIKFPFLGKMQTGGKSAHFASSLIEDGLRGRYLLDPQVRIVPEELTPPSISIGGQVERPGSYPLGGQPTLLRMVNKAQGLTEFAKYDDVLIMRNVAGQDYIGVYNIGAVQRGNYADPTLFAGDIVVVGDSPERRRLATILQLVPLVTSAAIIVNQISN